MPGPQERSPSGAVLDFFDDSRREPHTASGIADETGYSLRTVEDELEALVDRGLLETKETDGGVRVWWATPHDPEDRGGAEPADELDDATADRDPPNAPQRLMDQHRQLAQFVTRIDVTDDLDEILRLITEEARELVGAHQSVTSRTVNQDWEQAINAVSLSEKYAEYREYDTRPDGSGIYSLVCERNEPMRLTQAELESHPAWNAFGDEGEEHPPMRGWLAVPIVGPEGQNTGLIQLSDKYEGEFTEADEAILVQLANVASAAIENARLYRELRESEQRYRTLVENFPGGAVTLYDEDLRYVAAGGENVRRVGRTVEDLVGSLLRDAIPDELARQLEPHYRAAIEEEELQTFEAEYDGTSYLFRALPVRDESGEVYAGMGMSQDITAQKERERALEEYEAIVETIPDGVYVLDEDHRFQLVNEAFCELTGYRREELLGADATLVSTERGHERGLELREQLRTGEIDVAVLEEEVPTAGGGTFDAEIRFVDLRDDEGEFRGTAGVIRDVTERLEYERRLEASNERLEQFAYAASHDLQEPLRMVSSYLQLIEERYADALDEDGREFIDFAVDGADRMREMVDALLTYSRVETEGDPFEPVDLNAVLADARDDLQVKIEESDAELAVDDLPRVEGDPSQLRQVFQNLLDNAIEYSGDEPPRIRVTADRSGTEWTLSVLDEGIGIDPDHADTVFQVFRRLHGHDEHPGTGIGLALCERIVERHGGRIWVDSEPGEGSTFSFTLPAVDP